MDLDRYLGKIQNSSEQMTSSAAGMGFAIDSFPSTKKRKKKSVMRVAYPKRITESTNTTPKRVLIDLDRTIHKYSKGFADGTLYDTPIQDARSALEFLKKKGYEVVIFSARPCVANRSSKEEVLQQRQFMKEWLQTWKIPYDRISCVKLDAVAIIDDRAITFHTWQQALQELEEIEKRNIGPVVQK